MGDSLLESLPRPADPGADVAGVVSEIIGDVRREGDAALRRLTAKFDGHDLTTIQVDPSEVEAAVGRIELPLRRALETAYGRIVRYHSHEAPALEAFEDAGLRVHHREVPVDRAGCYAPGGRARYPSSVLMCAGPARVAGVASLALCVPAGPDGRIDDATLAAAWIAGIDEVFAIGGAQAIAAMAYGTESIAPVDVIVGPGNAYVAEAKRQVSGAVGVASGFAGPSEIVVIGDASTPPELAAIDLMVQAEHGPDGMAWLVTWDEELARRVDEELDRLIELAPRREDLLKTMAASGVVCLVDDETAALAVSNAIAPEHLELLVEDYDLLAEGVRAAGAVFCGIDAPATLGDYAAGPNHILPTNRTARFASALRADDFRRHIHIVEVSRSAFDELAPTVIALAESEGLAAHADSIRMRQ